MIIRPAPKDSLLWHSAPSPKDAPVPGHDAWLETELAAGIADSDAGRVTALVDVRKEFGLD